MIKYLFSPMLEDHKMKLGSNEHWISALEMSLCFRNIHACLEN